jgi:hypothetical protein
VGRAGVRAQVVPVSAIRAISVTACAIAAK